MRTLVGSLVFLCLLGCFSRVAMCQDGGMSSSSQRKLQLTEYIQDFFLSDAVRCQEKGEWQLTGGVESRQHIGTSGFLRTEYGVTDRLQLGVEVPYGLTEEESSVTTSRWSTASLGVEYQIIRSDVPFALSAGITFGIPVRSGGEVEYQPLILVAKSFRKLQIHASFVADFEEEKPSFQYNLASVYPFGSHWFPTLEFNGRSLHGNGVFYVTPGLYRHLGHRLEVGAGFPFGAGGTAGRLGIVAKFTWEIGGDDKP
jgi:hypothetical protein